MRRRTRIFCICMAVICFGVLLWRLFVLQIIDPEDYAARAADQQLRDTVIPAARGEILSSDGTVLAALDARRGEVYWAAFDLESHARLTPDAASPVKELAQIVENCKKPLFFVGDGAALCYNEYGQAAGVLPCPPALGLCRGAGVCLAARAVNARNGAVPAAALAPSYLRLSQAERERAAQGLALRP